MIFSNNAFLAKGVGVFSALIALLFAGKMHASNILTNAGFEAGSLAGWTTFGNSIGNVSVQSGAGVAHSGTYYLKTYGQFITATNYSGVYQDNLSAPSNTYT